MRQVDDDTIVALATARGVAALAIVRLSGPASLDIAGSCFPGIAIQEIGSHTLAVGFISTSKKEEIDQVVVSVFLAPHSVTGENVVEITCHGGDYAAARIIQSLIEAGARPAQPGEFTKRGFLNGRMDLSQAEAVANIIDASSRRAQESSLAQLKGGYSVELEAIRSEMLDLCAAIELELDFSEEDVEFASPDRLTQLFKKSQALFTSLLESYRFGALIRDGIQVVIGGRPNAGKSTLLNALVGYERAIVSDVPGTTRDEIEAEVEFDGLRIRFRDTAGLRDTQDAIEAEGVRRAKESIRHADALFYVFDALIGLDQDEKDFLARMRSERPDLVIKVFANKVDLLRVKQAGAIEADSTQTGAMQADTTQAGAMQADSTRAGAMQADKTNNIETDILAYQTRFISAKEAQSDETILLPVLTELIDSLRGDWILDEAAPILTNLRHRDHLQRALTAVGNASQAWESSASGDILSLELRTAMFELGAITGATTNEDVLSHIFSEFCIGK